jgi:hypothetical protein
MLLIIYKRIGSSILQRSSVSNLLRSISSVTYANNADADSSGGDPTICSTPVAHFLSVRRHLSVARSLCAASLVLYAPNAHVRR